MTASWPQAVQPDPEATARSLSLLESAGAISTYMKVKMRSPELDEPEVLAEVRRIRDDKAQQTPAGDPFNARSGEPNEEESDDEVEPGYDEGQEQDPDEEEPVGGGSRPALAA